MFPQFASVGRPGGQTFSAAKTLALGIGLQNFPEGLAVSLVSVGGCFTHAEVT